MENVNLYEGESHKRLEIIIRVILPKLDDFGSSTFPWMIREKMNKILADLMWDGYDSIKENSESVIETLTFVNKQLVKLEAIVNEEEYKELQILIEPLEIVISELTLAFL